MNEMLSVTDVANELGKHTRTIIRYITRGHSGVRLKATKPGRGQTSAYVILRSDLDAYKAAQEAYLEKRTKTDE